MLCNICIRMNFKNAFKKNIHLNNYKTFKEKINTYDTFRIYSSSRKYLDIHTMFKKYP